MGNKAIIYARVSTDAQAEYGTSRNEQVKACQAYADRLGLDVVYTAEEDYSGVTLDRPELNKVRAMLQARDADHMLVYKVDRQDRSWAGVNYLVFLQELKDLGIRYHKVEQGREVDLNDSSQILMESIEGWNAGRDHNDTVKKLHKGRIARAQNGHIVGAGQTPYGYTKEYDETTRRYFWKINEVEAEVIRLIYEWYVNGDETGMPMAFNSIAMRLSREGIDSFADRRGTNKKLMGRGQWCASAVRKILTNETYAGTWHYAKSENFRNSSRQFVDKTAPTDIAVSVPAIIDQAMFKLAAERRERRKTMCNKRMYDYLLVNHVKCGDCGGAMLGASRNKHVKKDGKPTLYYRCKSQSNSSTRRLRDCKNKTFRCGDADPAVWQWLEEFIFNEEKLERGLRDYQTSRGGHPLQQELNRVIAELTDLDSQFMDATTNMRTVTSPRAKAVFAADLERIEDQQNGLEARRKILEAELADLVLTEAQITDMKRFAARMRDNWDTISGNYDLKREALNRLNIQVTLFVDEAGDKYAAITGKLSAEQQIVSIGGRTTHSCNRYRTINFSGVVRL